MKTKKPETVFVALSGGVDSSIAAALLKKQGCNVIGCHMKCYNLDGCGEQDAEDARRVAEILKIPFYVFDFEKEYKNKVVAYMVGGYRKGITPNPDVMCNKEIKFGLFMERALAMGADFVATGHYVRIKKTGAQYSLLAAKDKNKDQSYFLWTLKQNQLKYCLFPIGNYLKSEVRLLAKKFRLPTASKKDSQGICFLGQISLKEFLKAYLPAKEGLVLNTAGKVVGKHDGAYFYTIGQRQGLNLGGSEQPYYIAEKDAGANAILVAEGKNNPALYRKEVKVANLNLAKPLRKNWRPLPVLARVRYRQPLSSARLFLKKSSGKLVFNQPQKFIAPGQSAVFYSAKGQVLGGGIIL